MHASRLLATVRRSWWIAVLCAGVGAAGGAVVAASTPPAWTSDARLRVIGPDVQDTVTGALVTEMAAKSATELVDDPALGASRQPGVSAIVAAVPFGSSDVTITATADTRARARAAVALVSAGMVDAVTEVDAHVALSPTNQRAPVDLAVRLTPIGSVTAPAVPESPVPVISVLAGVVAGLGLGSALMVLREALDRAASRPVGAHRDTDRRSTGSGWPAGAEPARNGVADSWDSARGGHRTC